MSFIDLSDPSSPAPPQATLETIESKGTIGNISNDEFQKSIIKNFFDKATTRTIDKEYISENPFLIADLEKLSGFTTQQITKEELEHLQKKSGKKYHYSLTKKSGDKITVYYVGEPKDKDYVYVTVKTIFRETYIYQTFNIDGWNCTLFTNNNYDSIRQIASFSEETTLQDIPELACLTYKVYPNFGKLVLNISYISYSAKCDIPSPTVESVMKLAEFMTKRMGITEWRLMDMAEIFGSFIRLSEARYLSGKKLNEISIYGKYGFKYVSRIMYTNEDLFNADVGQLTLKNLLDDLVWLSDKDEENINIYKSTYDEMEFIEDRVPSDKLNEVQLCSLTLDYNIGKYLTSISSILIKKNAEDVTLKEMYGKISPTDTIKKSILENIKTAGKYVNKGDSYRGLLLNNIYKCLILIENNNNMVKKIN